MNRVGGFSCIHRGDGRLIEWGNLMGGFGCINRGDSR